MSECQECPKVPNIVLWFPITLMNCLPLYISTVLQSISSSDFFSVPYESMYQPTQNFHRLYPRLGEPMEARHLGWESDATQFIAPKKVLVALLFYCIIFDYRFTTLLRHRKYPSLYTSVCSISTQFQAPLVVDLKLEHFSTKCNKLKLTFCT